MIGHNRLPFDRNISWLFAPSPPYTHCHIAYNYTSIYKFMENINTQLGFHKNKLFIYCTNINKLNF